MTQHALSPQVSATRITSHFIKTIIAVPCPVLCNGIVATLDEHPHITVLGIATTSDAALHLVQTLHPDVLVLDEQLPDGQASDVIQYVLSVCPPPRAY